MRTVTLIAAGILVAALAVVWLLTLPATVPASALPAYTPNVDNGRTMFNAGGCASCHATPAGEPDKMDRTRLGGGLGLKSPFGTFYVPNISPDPSDGIGEWSEANFVTALWKGTSPWGKNLFPAFPYTSYQNMALADMRDLFGYLKTLPPVTGRTRRHDLMFPFNLRRLVGVWKLLFLHDGTFAPDPSQSAQWNRGAYLVNGPGHCAECHSPRNFLGAIVESQRFAGGPSPDGKSFVPNITPVGLQHWSKDDIAWSQSDIATFLESGMDPSGDYAGDVMAEVIRNISLLDTADRAAIAAYIVSLPPRQGPKPPPKKK
ncbi:MAG TPA: c-type cytochrome [Xanthobacteraceae bacterium]|jgi:mono/diheme cytochrome c family protein|nr:c-type cytochrome [Xanthobacteraceae bacterium]